MRSYSVCPRIFIRVVIRLKYSFIETGIEKLLGFEIGGLGWRRSGAGETHEVGADAEAGTLAGRVTDAGGEQVKDGEGRGGDDGEHNELLAGHLALGGDEEGGGADNETLHQILEHADKDFLKVEHHRDLFLLIVLKKKNWRAGGWWASDSSAGLPLKSLLLGHSAHLFIVDKVDVLNRLDEVGVLGVFIPEFNLRPLHRLTRDLELVHRGSAHTLGRDLFATMDVVLVGAECLDGRPLLAFLGENDERLEQDEDDGDDGAGNHKVHTDADKEGDEGRDEDGVVGIHKEPVEVHIQSVYVFKGGGLLTSRHSTSTGELFPFGLV